MPTNCIILWFLKMIKLQLIRARFNLAAYGKTESVQFIWVGTVCCDPQPWIRIPSSSSNLNRDVNTFFDISHDSMFIFCFKGVWLFQLAERSKTIGTSDKMRCLRRTGTEERPYVVKILLEKWTDRDVTGNRNGRGAIFYEAMQPAHDNVLYNNSSLRRQTNQNSSAWLW